MDSSSSQLIPLCSETVLTVLSQHCWLAIVHMFLLCSSVAWSINQCYMDLSIWPLIKTIIFVPLVFFILLLSGLNKQLSRGQRFRKLRTENKFLEHLGKYNTQDMWSNADQTIWNLNYFLHVLIQRDVRCRFNYWMLILHCLRFLSVAHTSVICHQSKCI